MVLSIHQPSYFPWLGLLNKISNSDVYMVMDEVQLSDSAYQHRNLFLSADGKVKYLTIPFNKKNYLQRPIGELELLDDAWQVGHLNFIRNGYRKHPFFDEIFPEVEDFYTRSYARLIDAVMASMRLSLGFLGIGTKLVYQSEMSYDRSARRGDLVIGLARAAGADCYLSGVGAQDYLDESAFPPGLTLKYNYFSHPVYAQKNAGEFTPGLACLDMLFNLGVEGSRDLLKETLGQ